MSVSRRSSTLVAVLILVCTVSLGLARGDTKGLGFFHRPRRQTRRCCSSWRAYG